MADDRNRPEAQPRATQDAPNLDLLRTTAVMFVVVSHLLPPLGIFQIPHYHIQALGILGVVMFFVHTSLVLMFSLERQSASSAGGPLYLPFIVRRVFRIFPLSVVAVLTTIVLSMTGLGEHFILTTRAVVANLLLVQNVTRDVSIPAPLWSLPFEMQMYLALPLFFAVARPQNRARARVLVSFWFVSVGAVLVAWRIRVDYTLIKYIPDFIPGIVAYASWTTRIRLASRALPIALAAVALAFPVLVAHGVPESLLAMPVCLALGLLLPRIRETTNATIASLTNTIAKYSYGVYLFHVPAIWFAFTRPGSTPLGLRVAEFVLLLVLVPWVMYHALERPMIGVGGRLAARLASR